MNSQPTVSICIANYNGMDIIDDCLQSILRQEGDISVEILIHDDASSDGSVHYLRERYPEVRLIESNKNVGFCVANNRMAEQARGEYLLLLNNDAALYSDALQTLLSEAERLAKPAILRLPQYDAQTGELIDIGCQLDPFYNPSPNFDQKRIDAGMVIGACLWIPKKLWVELAGFPEWFGSIAEDMYLCCRARLAGHKVSVLPISGYKHYQGKSFGGNRPADGKLRTTYRRRALSERNKTFVMIVMSPGAQLLFTLPIHLAFLGIEGLAITLLKRDAKVWNEIYYSIFKAIWNIRHKLIETRTEIQKTRIINLDDWLKDFVRIPRKLQLLFKYGIPELR